MTRWLVLAALLGCGHHVNGGQIAAATAGAVTEALLESVANASSEREVGEGPPCAGECRQGWTCVDNECVPPPDEEVDNEESCSPVPDAGSMLVVECDGG